MGVTTPRVRMINYLVGVANRKADKETPSPLRGEGWGGGDHTQGKDDQLSGRGGKPQS